MNDIKTRLAALEEALLLRKMEQEAPVDDLSRSLFNLRQELAGLDELGRSALLYELNHVDPLEGTMGLDLSMEDLEKMISNLQNERNIYHERI